MQDLNPAVKAQYPPEPQKKKVTTADKIRRFIVDAALIFIVPALTFLAYRNIVGDAYAFSENGQLILVGLMVLTTAIFFGAYHLLFSEYSDDLPGPFF